MHSRMVFEKIREPGGNEKKTGKSNKTTCMIESIGIIQVV